MKSKNKFTMLVDEIINENKKQLIDIKKINNFDNKESKNYEISPIRYKNDNSTFNAENRDKELGELNWIKKLEKKNNKIDFLKKRIFFVQNENSELIEKVMEHEKFRQQILEKLQSLDIEMTNKEKEFSNKEKMLIKHCQEIEGSKINIEEKYNKLFIDYTRELKFHKEETTMYD